MTDSLLKVALLPERPVLAVGERSQRFLLRLRAPRRAPSPLHLLVVADRSASMRGRRLRRTKKMAKHLVDSLEPTTLVSLISFDEHASVDAKRVALDGEGRRALGLAIDGWEPGVHTNLGAALMRAWKLAHEDDSTPAHVVVLTDGHATAGLCGRSVVELVREARGSTTLSAIGVGEGADAPLLACMARAGGGDVYFADGAEDEGDADPVEATLSREIESLRLLYASDVELSIRVAPGVHLAKVWERGPASRRDDARVVRLPRLVAYGCAEVAFELRWTGDAPTSLGLVTLDVHTADGLERRELPLRVSSGQRSSVDAATMASILARRLDAAVHDATTERCWDSSARWLERRIDLLAVLAEQENLVDDALGHALMVARDYAREAKRPALAVDARRRQCDR